MRKESRAMDSGWALEVMHKAPYITVSFIDEDEGVSKAKKHLQYKSKLATLVKYT